MTGPYARLEAEASEFYGAPCTYDPLLHCMNVPTAAWAAKKAAMADQTAREDPMTTTPKIDTYPIHEAILNARLALGPLAAAASNVGRVMNDWIAEQTAARIVGMKVIVAPHILPGPVPSDAENARRIVRQGLASVTLHGKPLVDPGAAPGERTHAVVMLKENTLMVSRELWERLQVEMPPQFAVTPEPLRSDVYQPVHAARTRAQFEQVSVAPVRGISL